MKTLVAIVLTVVVTGLLVAERQAFGMVAVPLLAATNLAYLLVRAKSIGSLAVRAIPLVVVVGLAAALFGFVQAAGSPMGAVFVVILVMFRYSDPKKQIIREVRFMEPVTIVHGDEEIACPAFAWVRVR